MCNKQVLIHKQTGFTLIELIIVIVIIGILAAVAIPKFVDLTGDAKIGVAKGVGAAGASASSVNYARRQAGTGGVAVNSCDDLLPLVDVPAGYSFTTDALASGTQSGCGVLEAGSGATPLATFNAYGSN